MEIQTRKENPPCYSVQKCLLAVTAEAISSSQNLTLENGNRCPLPRGRAGEPVFSQQNQAFLKMMCWPFVCVLGRGSEGANY